MIKNFTVLISIYHKENPAFLKAALESVLFQTSKPNEIVIVKDGPLGEALDNVIFEYSSKNKEIYKIVALEKNVGLGEALGIGLLHCSNEYVARMDTDDICVKDRFERQLDFLEANPEVDVCGMWIDEFNDDISEERRTIRKVPADNAAIGKMLKYRNPMNHVTVMFKKSSVLEAGSYKSFDSYEDYFIWARMLLIGKSFYNLQVVGVHVRIGGEMINRRMGLRYLSKDLNFFKYLYQKNIINAPQFIFNLFVRLARLLPSKLMKRVYALVLRD